MTSQRKSAAKASRRVAGAAEPATGHPRQHGIVDFRMSSESLQRGPHPAPGTKIVLQRRFPLDDLRHAQLAARRAGNPFFVHARVDPGYARAVFCGRGLLFTAHHTRPRPAWRVYLAYFAPMQGKAWFNLLPHAYQHADAMSARLQAEELAAQMHRGTWQQAIGLLVARAKKS